MVPSLSAPEYFTDRADLLAAFNRYVNAAAGESLRILVFAGASGSGKTTLLRRLQDQLRDTRPSVCRAQVNLENVGARSEAYREVLLRLRLGLENLPAETIEFPHFDLCWALLAARGSSELPSPIRPNYPLCELFEFAASVLQAPAAGLAAFVEETLEWSPSLQLSLQGTGGINEIISLRERALRDDDELPAELIQRFAMNLIENLPAAEDKACRAILFLDNYDMLWPGGEMDAIPQVERLDWWVRELAARCLPHGVLLVIASQKPLNWQDEPAWDEAEMSHERMGGGHQKLLDQYSFEGFAFHDAQEYLATCGIGPPQDQSISPLQHAIIQCCNAGTKNAPVYHPLPLALCAETVLRTRAVSGSDPEPALFNIRQEDADDLLPEVFFKALGHWWLELWLRQLSLTPRFDEAAALALLNRCAPNVVADRDAWETLLSLCFVEPQGDGFYRLHPTMREVLRFWMNKREAVNHHEWLARYWQERAENALAWFHQWAAHPPETLEQWARQHQILLEESRVFEARASLEQWADTTLDESDRRLVGDGHWARTHTVLGDAHRRTPTVPPDIASMLALGHYLAALLVYNLEYFPDEWAQTHLHLASLLCALTTGEREENLQQAASHYRAALQVQTRERSPEKWASIMHDLGHVYRELPAPETFYNIMKPVDDVHPAIACFQAALQVYTEDRSPEQWAKLQHSLGQTHYELAGGHVTTRLRQAIAHFRAAARVYAEVGLLHEWAGTQLALGNAYFDLRADNRHEALRQAVTAYQAALRLYNETDFPAECALTQFNLGQAYAEIGNESDDAYAYAQARNYFMAASAGFAAVGAQEHSVKAGELFRQIDEWLSARKSE